MNSSFVDPRLKGLAMGSSEWFAAQRAMIESKPSIKRCYELWHTLLIQDAESVPPEFKHLPVLELGSGSSFLRERCPGLITSDVTAGNVDTVIDGRQLPFAANSLRALFLTHVFHHIPDVGEFLKEAERVLVPGGVISMVEVTHTPFARFFFSACHPEPFKDKATSWSFPPGHSMLDSNQALAWMVFFRDHEKMVKTAPLLTLERWKYLPWFSYLLSGGVNLRSFIPNFLNNSMPAVDKAIQPLDPLFAIHWHMTIRKTQAARK